LPGATVLRLQLETGRTHQVRIHCAESGHPVLGDDHYLVITRLVFERFVKKDWKVLTPENPATEARALFDAGQKEVILPSKMPRRIALHSTKISLRHPMTNKALSYEAPLPSDLTKYIEILRHN